jgi:hypothetical protein
MLFQDSIFLKVYQKRCFKVQIFYGVPKCCTSKYFLHFLKSSLSVLFYCSHECKVDNIDISKYIEL